MKKVMTFKSGKFVFSAKYDFKIILPKMIEAITLNKTIIDLPILPDLSSTIHTDLIRRSIFGTAAIEGNPLSEEKVGEIIEQTDTIAQTDHEKEITNLKNAYDFIDQSGKDSNSTFSEKMIRELHKTITEGINYIDNVPGIYRNHVVKVGDKNHGGIYRPPKILEDIKLLMGHYIRWMNSPEILEEYGIIRSILSHYYLALIHPFGDGNGRTARLAEVYFFKKVGFVYVPEMLSNYYYRNMDGYYQAFSKSIKNKEHDVTDFLDFALTGVLESLKENKSQIIYFIRLFCLKDYYNHLKLIKAISRRQHDLIQLIISMNIPFTLYHMRYKEPFSVLFRGVSDRTIRRDFDRLRNLGLIKLNQEDKFECNYNVLDRR